MKKLIIICIALYSPVYLNAQDLSSIFDKVSPSVVQIQVKEKVIVGEGYLKQQVIAEALGSGVLISSDGLILTAAHVVETAEEVKVVFKNGKVMPAKILGTEKVADVALIKLTRPLLDRKIFIPKLADSDSVKTGQQIFVIGSPFGLAQSLSVGHISGRHKSNSAAANLTFMEFFQTDAAINTGNSGGPMFNMEGEIIGIVSYILSRSGGFQGLGFAATSNMATKLLLEKKGIWYGVEVSLLTGELARIFNLPQDGGILVEKVADKSPGAIMGLKGGIYNMEIEGEELLVGGDIILSILGNKIISEEHVVILRDKMKALKKGDVLSMSVLRGGKIIELKYTVAN
jgi:S1-C subfamily serine protease